ncbi:MAG: hypothetical protein LBS00_02925 [Synergistaceae bacterium]|jgi:hypothetical protein|nr:hypothetical protein [Synergistaceae bacterium]
MKQSIVETLDGIHQAFQKLGFKPLKFDDSLLEKYAGYKWYLIPFWRVELVLYAVPAVEKLEEQPWESWYRDKGEECHHIHYAFKMHESDQEWSQTAPSDDRPDEIIGRVWYWYAADIKPALL